MFKLVSKAKGFFSAMVALCVAVLFSTPAQAAIDMTGITMPLTEVEGMAAIVLAFIVSISVVYGVLKIARSKA